MAEAQIVNGNGYSSSSENGDSTTDSSQTENGCLLKKQMDTNLNANFIKNLSEEHVNPEELLTAEVYCAHRIRGCRKTMLLKDLEAHQKECLYSLVPCPQKCGQGVTIRSLPTHMANECPRRLVQCIYCSEEVPFDDKLSHEEHCPKKPITCQFCQADSLLQEQLQRHLSECAFKPRGCKMADIGCKFLGNKNEIEEHEKSWEQHIGLITSLILERNKHLEAQHESLGNQITEVATESKQAKMKQESVNRDIDALKKKVKSLQVENDSLRGQLLQTDVTVKSEVKTLKISTNVLQKAIENLKGETEQLLEQFKEAEITHQAEAKNLKSMLGTVQTMVEGLKNKIQQIRINENHKSNDVSDGESEV